MNRVRLYHLQAIYWSSIGWDVTKPFSNRGVIVLGYIKSGTNWLCHLLSDTLDIPVLEPWKRSTPQLEPCVYHMHRFLPFKSVRNRTVYLIRDGRDTVVSGYFHLRQHGGKMQKDFERYMGRELSVTDPKDDIADYVHFIKKNRTSTVDYKSHIDLWQRHQEDYISVRYEELLTNPTDTVARTILELGYDIPAEKIKGAVDKHDFSRVAKRDQGVEDQSAFLRKGIRGDWKNYFTPAAAEAFDDYAGDALIFLGYEKSRDWVESVEVSPNS